MPIGSRFWQFNRAVRAAEIARGDAQMTRPSPEAEAAAMLRRVLDAVHRGELDADGREALGLLRRMEGAAAALEASSASQKR